MSQAQNLASDGNDVNGSRRIARLAASGRGRQEASQVVIMRNPPKFTEHEDASTSTQEPTMPKQDVSQRLNDQGTTKTGTKHKWTPEENKCILRAYFEVTKAETLTRNYRKKLHERLIAEFPYLSNRTEQNIADQRRSITLSNLIPATEIERIKQEVQGSINVTNTNETTTQNTHVVTTVESPISNNITEEMEEMPNIPTPTENYKQELRNKFEQYLTEYTGVDPNTRPRIHRQSTSKKLAILINIMNTNILPEIISANTTLTDINTIVYSAALAIINTNNPKYKICYRNKKPDNLPPEWQTRLQKKIDSTRSDIARVIAYKSGNPGRKLKKEIENIKQKYKQHAQYNTENKNLDQMLDTAKQKLKALLKRIRRYKEAHQRKQQNKQFSSNEKRFYAELENQNKGINEMPGQNKLEKYWSDL